MATKKQPSKAAAKARQSREIAPPAVANPPDVDSSTLDTETAPEPPVASVATPSEQTKVSKPKRVDTVPMIWRPLDEYGEPTGEVETADVHPDEVAARSACGWEQA